MEASGTGPDTPISMTKHAGVEANLNIVETED